jgi:hypothetical protein
MKSELEEYYDLEITKAKYLAYNLEEYLKVDKKIKSYFSSRDKKIDLVLDEMVAEGKKITDNDLSEIKKLISKINLLDINVELLEEIAKSINCLNSYLEEYLIPTIDKKDSEIKECNQMN